MKSNHLKWGYHLTLLITLFYGILYPLNLSSYTCTQAPSRVYAFVYTHLKEAGYNDTDSVKVVVNHSQHGYNAYAMSKISLAAGAFPFLKKEIGFTPKAAQQLEEALKIQEKSSHSETNLSQEKFKNAKEIVAARQFTVLHELGHLTYDNPYYRFLNALEIIISCDITGTLIKKFSKHIIKANSLIAAGYILGYTCVLTPDYNPLFSKYKEYRADKFAIKHIKNPQVLRLVANKEYGNWFKNVDTSKIGKLLQNYFGPNIFYKYPYLTELCNSTHPAQYTRYRTLMKAAEKLEQQKQD